MSDTTSETRDERRTADRRQVGGEPTRVNPEVMGRTEPVAVADRTEGESAQPHAQETMAHTDRADRTTDQIDFWPPMGEFSRRLEEIQSEFINDPRAAVKRAERLVEEAADHMAKSVREHVKRLHGDAEGNADTEKLRVMMRNYRAFIVSIGSKDGHREA